MAYQDPTVAATIEALRKKYAPIAQAQAASAAAAASSSSTGEVLDDKSTDAYHRLDKFVVCGTCGGGGVINTNYNHMTMSRTCTACLGDGIDKADRS